MEETKQTPQTEDKTPQSEAAKKAQVDEGNAEERESRIEAEKAGVNKAEGEASQNAAPAEDESKTIDPAKAIKEMAEKKAEEAVKGIKDQMMRLQADFENYKKRTVREKTDIAAFTMENFMTKLLPVIDNLERSEAAAEAAGESGSYRDGVKMVFDQLMGVLDAEGLKAIDAEGQPFDPNFHHGVAVGNEPEVPDQTVLEVFQKGYTYKDKVIRPAMVKVNQL